MRRFMNVLAMVAIAALGLRSALAQEVRYELNLHGAVFHGDAPGIEGPSLLFDITRNGDTWQRGWAVVGDVWKNAQPGYITKSTITPDTIDLAMDVDVRPDTWAREGLGQYTITLKKSGDGLFTGTYEGTFKGVKLNGKAEARVVPAAKLYQPPVATGEHPRLLFREADLPALRAKAKTPFGQAAIKAIEERAEKNELIAMGVLYQLYGDKKLPERAIPLIEKIIKEGLVSDQFGNNVGERVMPAAIAYDCFYDAWPADFRAKVETFFLYVIHSIRHTQGAMNTSINWHVSSNWSAPLYMGAGYAGLAMYDDKGPGPEKPAEPLPITEAAPARDLKPGAGVPRSTWENDKMPADWIYAGGFVSDDLKAADPLATLGGAAQARPEVGTVLKAGRKEDTFRVLSKEKDKGYYDMRGTIMIDITNAIGRVYHSRSYLYHVLDLPQAGWYRVGLGHGGAVLFINGTPRRDGEYIKLDAGAYPLLLQVDIAQTNPWGRDLLQPRLIAETEDAAKAYQIKALARHAEKLRIFEHGSAIHRANGGRDTAKDLAFGASRRMMYTHFRESVGTGGFQAEITHYGMIATGQAMRYAPAYRSVMGQDVSPFPDITHHVPQKLFNHIFLPDRTIAQEINGQIDVDARYVAWGFSTAPEEMKPFILWAWMREAKATTPEGIIPTEPVLAFLHVPADMRPHAPKGIMPLTWHAPGFGYAGFRNGWDGDNDILLQVFARTNTIGGWNGPNAGTFRFAGLGAMWAHGPKDRNRSRWEENVVWLPDDTINLGAQGRIVHLDQRPDGSGSMTIDMNDVYATTKEKGGRLYQRYGNVRRESAFASSGITGLRAIAVDYSGKSGAPATLVVVDRIHGGGKKVWAWQLAKDTDPKDKNAGDLKNTTVDGNSFTVKKNGATLRGTFISPAQIKVIAEGRQFTMIGGAGSSAGKTLSRPVDGIFAETEEKTVDIICVITLTREAPPAVTSKQENDRTVISIGNLTTIWNGKTLEFKH